MVSESDSDKWRKIMKVSIEMNCSQISFFDYLTQSLMTDIFKNTDHFRPEDEIKKGLCYKKKIKREHQHEYDAYVEITEYKKPSIVQSKIQIGSNTHISGYEISKLDDEHIKVTYIEIFDSTKKLNVWNFKLMNLLLSRVNKKKMKRMLEAMETHILGKDNYE